MSNEQELERLRADLEVLERYFCDGCAKVVRDKIAALEAEADPWREAKGWVSSWRGQDDYPVVVKYIDHLAAENARLEKRVAELEAEDTADVADAEAALAKGEFVPFEDMQPPFEGPIESIEPVLYPARVLLTAIGILVGKKEFRGSAAISDAMFRLGISADKPYRLKGAGE